MEGKGVQHLLFRASAYDRPFLPSVKVIFCRYQNIWNELHLKKDLASERAS